MERPTPIEPRILRRLFEVRTRLQGELAEVDMEIQRLQMGIAPKLEVPKDRFWRQTIDFNQTRTEQANAQSDAKQMVTQPPYENLLQ